MITFVALSVAGCGSSADKEVPTKASLTEPYSPARAGIPTCAKAPKAIALPKGFPKAFPLPAGTALTSTRKEVGGTVVQGYVPFPSFASGWTYFRQQTAAAGFKKGDSDAEPPKNAAEERAGHGEAESEWSGHGYVGRWKINAIAHCTGALYFQAFAQPGKGR